MQGIAMQSEAIRPPSLANSIVDDLKTKSNISQQTVTSLRALLALDLASKGLKAAPKRSQTSKTQVSKSKRTKSQPSAAASKLQGETAGFEVHLDSQSKIHALSQPAKQKLATEAFNASLKHLTEETKRITSDEDQLTKVKTTSRNADSKPLKQSSPNRRPQPTILGHGKETRSDNIDVIADCAVAALCYLCWRKSPTGQDEVIPRQQDQGALLLLDRLTSLGLYDKASLHATNIHEYHHHGRSSDKTSKDRTTITTKSIKPADIILLDKTSCSKTEFQFISSYQSQVIRIALASAETLDLSRFTYNVSLDVPGSPAFNILQGKVQGYLTNEKAGLHLQTISQALLKLYSRCCCKAKPVEAKMKLGFSLLIQALLIKCKSWQLLQHDPRLEQELWKYLIDAAKLLISTVSVPNGAHYDFVAQHVQKTREFLKQHDFLSTLPSSAVNFLTNLAERSGRNEEALEWLDQQIASPQLVCANQNFILNARVAILKQMATHKPDSELNMILESSVHALKTVLETSTNISDQVFLFAIRLRKAVAELLDKINQTKGSCENSGNNPQIIDLCVSLLFGLYHLAKRSTAQDVSKIQSAPDFQPPRASIMTILKAIEALLNILPYRVSMGVERQSEYLSNLDDCQLMLEDMGPDVLQSTQDEPARKFFSKLCVCMSTVRWQQYLESWSGLDDTDFVSLEKSISIVSRMDIDVQCSASVGMKLERQGLAYLKKENFDSAKAAFERAIAHQIARGLLADVVTTAATITEHCLWAQVGTKKSKLKQALDLHVRLALTHGLLCSQSSSFLYDDEKLEPLQRFFLRDIQISTAMEHAASEDERHQLNGCIKQTIEYCLSMQLHEQCSRFVLKLLQWDENSPSFDIRDVLGDKTIQILCPCHSAEDHGPVDLAPRISWLREALRLQWTSRTNRLDLDMVRTCLDRLSPLIVEANTIPEARARLGDITLISRLVDIMFAFARALDDSRCMLRCLLLLCHLHSLQLPSASSQYATCLYQIAVIYSRCGDSNRAHDNFKTAQQILSEVEQPCLARVKLALAHAEHLLSWNNTAATEQMLKKAFRDYSLLYVDVGSLSSRKRLERDILISWAAIVTSKLALHLGKLDEACIYSRQAVKISAGIWQAVRHSSHGKIGQKQHSPQQLSLPKDDQASGLISSKSSKPFDFARAATESLFWESANLNHAALSNMGTISIHNGLHQDAIYYSDQLLELAGSVSSTTWIYRARAALALTHAKSGRLSEAKDLVQDLGFVTDQHDTFEQRVAQLNQIESLIYTGMHEIAAGYLDLLTSKARVANFAESKVDDAPTQSKRPVTQSSRTRIRRDEGTKKTVNRNKSQPPLEEASHHRTTIQNKIAVLRYLLRSASSSVEESLGYADQPEAQGVECNKVSNTLSGTMAKDKLEQAFRVLSSDAIRCALPESAIALPVKYQPKERSKRVSLMQAQESPIAARAKQKSRGKKLDGAEKRYASTGKGEQLIKEAYDLLPALSEISLAQCSSEDLHTDGKLRCKLALLSSAMDKPFVESSLDLVLQLLLSQDLVHKRELYTCTAETSTKEKQQVLQWPELSPTESSETHSVGYAELTENTIRDLGELPSSWSIVSIRLSDDHKEIFVSKVSAHHSPFMLRIPLSRSNLDIPEETTFTFQDAKSELTEMVIAANASCHDSRGQGNKESRKAWFAEREALDEQLGYWLNNIENIWFGGFKGLLCSQHFTANATACFEKALLKSLDKHLPSRQNPKLRPTSDIVLHPHVLELFMGLGNPELQELDDALLDLLSFVIDILQFNGELNPYDEIDFDALLVEVIDALTACHEQSARSTLDCDMHTILILDKELESFPFESMPCLSGESVSRMPSLEAILERVGGIRQEHKSSGGYKLSTTKGAYMLNPSSDLASTESTFRPILETNLPSFTASVRTPPSEAAFESTLRHNDIFLYFGHGSGAQYIRGRTIRAMESCAVTLLMGCSSAKMIECGNLESYGMPGYYIGGKSGCMAMVGTLWDVTDRDIDRFAVKLMLEWGLISEDEHVEKVLERSKRKIKGASTRSKREATSKQKKRTATLDQAVNKGREACVLKYLNGAAPVMYGLPVFLE